MAISRELDCSPITHEYMKWVSNTFSSPAVMCFLVTVMVTTFFWIVTRKRTGNVFCCRPILIAVYIACRLAYSAINTIHCDISVAYWIKRIKAFCKSMTYAFTVLCISTEPRFVFVIVSGLIVIFSLIAMIWFYNSAGVGTEYPGFHCPWLECDTDDATNYMAISHKRGLNKHVTPDSISSASPMSQNMFPIHEVAGRDLINLR